MNQDIYQVMQVLLLLILYYSMSIDTYVNKGEGDAKVSSLTEEYSNKEYGTVILGKKDLNSKGFPLLRNSSFNNKNTIYIIKYDFELAESIILPDNCVLRFEGGSINGPFSLKGQNTKIEAGMTKVFSLDVSLTGTWNEYSWNICWFGASPGKKDNAPYIKKALDVVYSLGTAITGGYGFNDCSILIPSGVFTVSSQIEVNGRFNVYGVGSSSVIYSRFSGNLFVIKGIRGVISLNNVTFICDDTARNACNCITLNTEQGTALGRISNCDFVNYNIALNLDTPYWFKITSCNFVYSGEYAIKARNANSFSIVSSNFRTLDGEKTSASHLYFTGGMQGLCIIGCDFSGGYRSSIVLERANGYGIQITGNYFEPGFMSVCFGGLIEADNCSITDLLFRANAAYESRAFDFSEKNVPRYYLLLRNSVLFRSDIVGNIIVDETIRGNSNSLLGRISMYSDFIDGNQNLIDTYYGIISRLRQVKGSGELNSALKNLSHYSELIQQKMIDNRIISDNIMNSRTSFSSVFSTIRNVENGVEYNNLEYNAGKTQNRPSDLNVYNGKQFFDYDLKAPVYFYNGKWIYSDGTVVGVTRSGPFRKKPLPENIYEGFQYFNTDTHRIIVFGDGKWWNQDGTEALR